MTKSPTQYQVSDFGVAELLKRGGWVMMFVLPVCLAAGIWLAFVGGRLVSNGSSSTAWPTTEGKILTLERGRQSKTIRRHGSNYTWATYEYRVGRFKYTCERVSFARSDDDENRALGSLQVGDSIPVYYNPRQEQEATLLTGGFIGALLPLIFAAIMIIMAVGIGVAGMNLFRKTGFFYYKRSV